MWDHLQNLDSHKFTQVPLSLFYNKLHLDNQIKHAKSIIDTRPPISYSHIIEGGKSSFRRVKEQILSRIDQIKKENLQLYDKISRAKSVEQSRRITPISKSPSSNMRNRVNQFKRIQSENELMIKNLKSIKPYYSKSEFHSFSKRVSDLAYNLSSYRQKKDPSLPILTSAIKPHLPLPKLKRKRRKSKGRNDRK